MINFNDLDNILKSEREQLLNELANMVPFRHGSLTTRYRRCGKPGCVCQNKDHPGHGPQIMLTYKEDGKTRTHNLAFPKAVEIVRQQLDARKSFQQWLQKWETLNKKICDQQLEAALKAEQSSEGKKKF